MTAGSSVLGDGEETERERIGEGAEGAGSPGSRELSRKAAWICARLGQRVARVVITRMCAGSARASAMGKRKRETTLAITLICLAPGSRRIAQFTIRNSVWAMGQIRKIK